MKTKSVLSLATAMLLATSGFAAFAEQNNAAAEAAALDSVTVSAAEAIAAVEAKGTGKVVEFTLLHEGATSVYHVTTLLPDGTETNYAVDAKTGAVVATVDTNFDEGDGDSETADDNGHHGDGEDQGDGDGETQDDGAN